MILSSSPLFSVIFGQSDPFVHGGPAKRQVVRMPTLVADTKAEAQRLTDNLMSLARRYYAGRAGIGSTDAGSASPKTAADANLFGTPEEVVERIHFLRENFSADEIMFEVNWTASVPRDVVMNTMRLITDKVIPQFK